MSTGGQFYVYEYRHPDTKVPFYVGKGAGRRYEQHLTSTHNTDFEKVLKQLEDSGKHPEIEKVFFSDDESVALGVEEHLIQSYGIKRKGGILCNWLEKAFGNNGVEVPEEVYELMGTVPDRVLGDVTGINWSTLRTKRMERGIPSFKERTKGTEEYCKALRRHAGESLTLYNTNGEEISGDRYFLADEIGTTVSSIGSLLSGKNQHIKGWFAEKEGAETSNIYTILEMIHVETGEVFKGNYIDFSSYTGITPQSASNVYKGFSNSIGGWCLNKPENIGKLKKFIGRVDQNVYTFKNRETGEVVTGLRKEVMERTRLHSGAVSGLCKSKCQHAYGWFITHINGDVFEYICTRVRK